MHEAPTQDSRNLMHNNNRLKLGLFGANCSNGRAMTDLGCPTNRPTAHAFLAGCIHPLETRRASSR